MIDRRRFREIDIQPPLSIPSLFEIGHVAYFSPRRHTFKQNFNFFLLQYGVTFQFGCKGINEIQFFIPFALNSATGSQTTILYLLKSQILTFSGQILQSTPKKKPQVIFSLWNPLRVPPGGMSGITGNLANFCGFCWFLTNRKILFGL